MMATVMTMPMATARWDCYHLGSCGGGHYGGAVTITAAARVGGDVDDVIASVGARVGGRVVGS